MKSKERYFIGFLDTCNIDYTHAQKCMDIMKLMYKIVE